MSVTTLSSRELNQDLGGAKKASLSGPVVITDRGKPAHVLLSYAEYLRLTASQRSLAAALAMPGGEDVGFEPPKVGVGLQAPELED